MTQQLFHWALNNPSQLGEIYSKDDTCQEDYVLKDETGSAKIHIWDKLVNKFKNGTTCEFQNLNNKHFN